MLKVVKRDGSIEDFNAQKVVSAVQKAFASAGCVFPEYLNTMVPALFEEGDIIGVEDIQDRVEQLLMNDKHFKAAKSYILYREKHKQARFIRERIDYMSNYADSDDNAASSSETDPNANVTQKNVANLDGEVYKTENRIIQRQRMKDKLNILYPEVAKQYEVEIGRAHV